MPETSRGLHYWQPAPIWRLLPWLENPGNLAIHPHTGKKEGSGWGKLPLLIMLQVHAQSLRPKAHGILMHVHMQKKLLTTRECWCSLSFNCIVKKKMNKLNFWVNPVAHLCHVTWLWRKHKWKLLLPAKFEEKQTVCKIISRTQYTDCSPEKPFFLSYLSPSCWISEEFELP